MTRSKLTAAGMAALLMLSVFASMPVAAQEESVSVETLSPIKVTEDKAELEGNLTALDNASEATVWFEYWPENDSANASATENLTVSSVGTFVLEAEDLESNTTYVAEAHAATENASAEGGEITFTTAEEEPLAVSTGAPTNVTNSSATFNGELTRLDAEGSATVWFEYWALGERTDAETTANQSLSAPGSFNASVEDLEPGTTYFVQAHGEAENETVAGAAVKFETLTGPVPLGVETNDASAVTNDSATLNGELTGLGGEDSADVWFEYWPQGDSGNATMVGNDTLDEPGAFSDDLSGLANNTTYVYVAHAAANNTTVAGDAVEFTTGAQDDTANRTWDGEGPFGQWLTGIIKNLVPADGQPLGQLVSDIVTANNPGSEHRSENANPGGNASGPPEHAGPPEDDANSTDDDNQGGPPDHAGPPEDDANTTDDEDEGGPPEDAGPPDDKGNDGNESEDNGPPDDAGSSDDDDGDNGPPDDAGPPEDDDGQSDDSDDDRDEEGENDGDDDDDEDEDGDDDDDEGGPPDNPGNGNGNGNGR